MGILEDAEKIIADVKEKIRDGEAGADDYNELGAAYAAHAMFDEAEYAFRAASRENPDDPKSLVTLATFFHNRCREQ